jgi:hypothetical protein
MLSSADLSVLVLAGLLLGVFVLMTAQLAGLSGHHPRDWHRRPLRWRERSAIDRGRLTVAATIAVAVACLTQALAFSTLVEPFYGVFRVAHAAELALALGWIAYLRKLPSAD